MTSRVTPSQAAAPMEQDTAPLGTKKVSDMISADTKIMANGDVYGTLKNVTSFEEFDKGNPELQSGYFFPFTLKGDGEGKTMTFKKNGAENKKDINYDKDIIFKVDDSNTTWEVLVNNESVVKLNFTHAHFE